MKNILTRTTGFLKTVSSHSVQPYRGCAFGNSLCGVGCYVQHNHWITQGRSWGSFLEVRVNAAERYRESVARESRWARRDGGSFGIFMSSSTDPFVPQESRYRITASLLRAMGDCPPDVLIVQTHTDRVTSVADSLIDLSGRCDVRVHLSIETDREAIPGLPPHASSVEARFAAARHLKARGLSVTVTVSPLLPIEEPVRFFERIAEVADAVVIDHFVKGDGTPDGRRTFATPLPDAIEKVEAGSTTLAYRDRIVEVARQIMPGRVGVHIAGFAGRTEA